MATHALIAHSSVSVNNVTPLQAVAGWLVRCAKAISNRFDVQRLAAMDERMLKDIGLVRSDVDAALDCALTVDPSVHLRDVAAGRSRLIRR